MHVFLQALSRSPDMQCQSSALQLPHAAMHKGQLARQGQQDMGTAEVKYCRVYEVR